ASDVFIVGTFGGTLNLPGLDPLTGSGASSIFLAKLRSDGTPIFAEAFGSDHVDFHNLQLALTGSSDVALLAQMLGALDFGNGTGELKSPTDYNSAIVVFDAAGKPRWSRLFTTTTPGGLSFEEAVGGPTRLVVTGFGLGQPD